MNPIRHARHVVQYRGAFDSDWELYTPVTHYDTLPEAEEEAELLKEIREDCDFRGVSMAEHLANQAYSIILNTVQNNYNEAEARTYLESVTGLPVPRVRS